MTARVATLLAVIVSLAAFESPAAPAPGGSGETRSLDQRLLEDLGADPLDEFDRELFAPDAGKPPVEDAVPGRPGTPGEPADRLDEDLLRELGAAATSEDENPLLGIAEQMRSAEGMIRRTESGPATQDLQDRIVADLDELIKQARSCCKQSSPSQCDPNQVAARQRVSQPKPPGAGNPKPGSTPVSESNAKPGSAEERRPDMGEMRDILKRLWGQLPERQREQMLQLPVEEFLPKYQQLIEEYFKRLAEEQGGGN
jgi:hypothetical protein